MILARLIDQEGVTIKEMALDDPPGHPRQIVRVAYPPTRKELLENAPLDARIEAREVEYQLDGRDGGGTFLYRRVTPLWKPRPPEQFDGSTNVSREP